MKRIKYLICGFVAVASTLISCGPDNMDAPDCHVYGRMTFNGNPIGVQGAGKGDINNGTVQIELWQAGFGKETAQNINVAQDGSFSTYIYPGDVRLITKAGVGPWKNADTLYVSVSGNTAVDYEVVPYFNITDATYTYDKEKGVLTATFTVNKGFEGAKVSALGVVVNNTQFVDLQYGKKSVNISGEEGQHTVEIDCSDLTDCKTLYARAFVRGVGTTYVAYATTPFKVW